MNRTATRAATHECIVPGCTASGRNRLGVRCRIAHDASSPFATKGRTSALWSPDADGYLCDAHALGGAHITLLVEPDHSKAVTIKAIAPPPVDERTIPIKQP